MASPAFEFNPDRHEYTQNGVIVPSVTQVLAKAGICDFSFVAEDVRTHSMKRGQSVHWLLQLEDEGCLDYRTVPRRLRGYRKAYKLWKGRSCFYPLIIEKPLISNFGFAGTPDRAGTFPATTMYSAGSAGVVEIKTGPVPNWSRLQMAAQCVLIQPRLALARIMRRVGLTLRPDGTYGVKEFPMCSWDQDWAEFMGALKQCQA